MNTIGVSFEISQSEVHNLELILKPIDVANYRWLNIRGQTESFLFPFEQNIELFDQELFDAAYLSERIQQKHFIIFLKLQAYRSDESNTNADFNNIDTFEEYINSNCQMVILIYDCEYVEIYSKNEQELHNFYLNALRSNFSNVCMITEENMWRTRMNIR